MLPKARREIRRKTIMVGKKGLDGQSTVRKSAFDQVKPPTCKENVRMAMRANNAPWQKKEGAGIFVRLRSVDLLVFYNVICVPRTYVLRTRYGTSHFG